MNKKTLILGASDNPARYSYLALKSLLKHGHTVEGVGKKPVTVDGVSIGTEKTAFQDIHTVTLYLNPVHQQEYYDYIISLKPQRLIFNPGTENPVLFELAKKNGIEPVEACTLVLLSINTY